MWRGWRLRALRCPPKPVRRYSQETTVGFISMRFTTVAVEGLSRAVLLSSRMIHIEGKE